MTLFRLLLIALFLGVVGYTIPVLMEHGFNLFPVFFGDIGKMAWPGQFNVDFMGFLTLAGVWVMWRNHFAPTSIPLGILAFLGGIPFLTAYLLILSFQPGADMKTIMLGRQRA